MRRSALLVLLALFVLVTLLLGWNATRLDLYSHCGTHMDAPIHFSADGAPADQIPAEDLVVPLVVEGATVDAWDIASPLIVLMLIPLGLGLLAKARYEEFADSIVAQTGQISSFGLMVGIVAALLVSWQDVIGAIGSWIFIGIGVVLALLARQLLWQRLPGRVQRSGSWIATVVK